ncbi:hypothetical protein ABEB36_014927 [Hypothenemus hampei]|uniref:Uncharacterized protein n=1 Tax=Hypothenemus hampei TaxID=57062 RepID=A0ABD1E5X0_HYPHA
MFAMRCLRNLNSPPFEISLDYGDDMFLFPSMFKVNKKSKLFMLDCLFSTVIIITLVVVVWRGVWTFMDFYFENNGIPDFWSYPIILIVFLIQLFILKLSRKLSRIPKLCLQNVYVIIALIGTISVWRGIWEILDQYFLPG